MRVPFAQTQVLVSLATATASADAASAHPGGSGPGRMAPFVTGSRSLAKTYTGEGTPASMTATGEPRRPTTAASGPTPSRLTLPAVPVPGSDRIPARVFVGVAGLTPQAMTAAVAIQTVVQASAAASLPSRVVTELPARAGALASRRAAPARPGRRASAAPARQAPAKPGPAMALRPMVRVVPGTVARTTWMVGMPVVAGSRAIRHVATTPAPRLAITFAVRP